jgi:hypothetical protein
MRPHARGVRPNWKEAPGTVTDWRGRPIMPPSDD